MRVLVPALTALAAVVLLSFPATSAAAPSGDAMQLAPYDSARAAAAAQVHGAEAATQAYLDAVPQARRDFTRQYAKGNYLYTLLQFVIGTLLTCLLLLATGLSRRLRDAAARVSRLSGLKAGVYWLMVFPIVAAIGFPLDWWHGFRHEKAFGLLHQSFAGWLADYGKGLLIGWLLGALVLAALYAVVARARRWWWVWAWVVMVVFTLLGQVLAPVYLMPIFNRFTPIHDAALRDSVLAMAHAYSVPAKEVYQMDAGRRTDRIGAFVTGIGQTMRVVVFDTTLRRCRTDETLFILGHELGHYVERHMWWDVLFQAVLTLAMLLVLKWSFGALARRWPGWGIEGIWDPAGLPLVTGVFYFALTPVTNGWTRYFESRADGFGLEASHRPDGAARGFLELGEYRDLDPSPAVEFIFYDHPSGRNRILHAMRWKEAHPGS